MRREAQRYAYHRSGFSASSAGPHAASDLKACLSFMAVALCGDSRQWCALAYNEVILDTWLGGGWNRNLSQMVRAIGIDKSAAGPAVKLAREVHSAALADGTAVPLAVYDRDAEREPFSPLPPAPAARPAASPRPSPSLQRRNARRLDEATAILARGTATQTVVCSPNGANAPNQSWHPYLFPQQIFYHPESKYCERKPAELGIDGAWLPVTHTRDRTERHAGGIWLYYASGCSDLLWHMGHTLLARNRAHAAILIEQRLAGGSELEASQRVVSWMIEHNEVGVLGRGARFFGRPLYNASNILGGAARGILGTPECLMTAPFWPNGSLHVCACACASNKGMLKRLFAMSGIIGHGALQMYAEAALAKLRARGDVWDTLQLSEQMQGHGSRRWAIEIWDIRYLPEHASSILGRENRSKILRRHALRASALNMQSSLPQQASACEASNVSRADFCLACADSLLEWFCQKSANKLQSHNTSAQHYS